jgi:hypothetical protein
MQERGSAVRSPKVLPWCITCNATLDLNRGAAENADLDDHARRWFAGSDMRESRRDGSSASTMTDIVAPHRTDRSLPSTIAASAFAAVLAYVLGKKPTRNES